MNFRKKQSIRFSDRWWKYNRKYWAPWVLRKAEKKAAEYVAFFNREAI